jgi:hypothetical protein
MAMQLTSVGERVRAFLPPFLKDRAKTHAPARENHGHDAPDRRNRPMSGPVPRPVFALSPEAEAQLASLDLPPDGPLDTDTTLRASLAPDVAARNFVSWARALDLVGHYSRRGVYMLYCEFSELDERPPLGPTSFLEALTCCEGISKEQPLVDGRIHRSWRWTIEPAKKVQVGEQASTQVPIAVPVAEPAPAPLLLDIAPPAAVPEPPAILLAPVKQAKSSLVLPRFVPDTDHPFSPAGLREREKNARRIRLNAGASRKQRGGLKRAA